MSICSVSMFKSKTQIISNTIFFPVGNDDYGAGSISPSMSQNWSTLSQEYVYDSYPQAQENVAEDSSFRDSCLPPQAQENVTGDSSSSISCLPCSKFVGFDPQLQGVLHSSISCKVATNSTIEREKIDNNNTVSPMVSCCLQALPFEGNSTCILTYGTGATRPSSGIRSDFEDATFVPTTTGPVIDGIASGLKIEGFGFTRYNIQVSDGTSVELRMKSFYVPGLNDTRLISPQGIKTVDGLRGSLEAYCNDDDPESFALLRFRHPSRYWQFTEPVHFCYVQYDSKTNLPQQTAYLSSDTTMLSKALLASIKTTEDLNQNLDMHQKALLQLHFRL